MIYLDCAATSLQKPKVVSAAVGRAMSSMASPGRGGHKPSMLAADSVLDCRLELASFFNVPQPEQVVFTFNATHALNIAIRALVSAGDKVVISGYEHNAVTRPLAALKARVHVAASPLFDQKAALDAFHAALPDAKCVVCTHVSNVFGFILPIEEIASLCRRRNIPLIIDASQSAGVLPLDFSALSADFIAMPGHKGLLGPQGTGVLLCNREPPPLLFGGTGSNSLSDEMPDFLPDRLEAGTHNVAGIVGLTQGVRFLSARPRDTVFRHEVRLRESFAQHVSSVRGLRLFQDESRSCQTGVLSATSARLSPEVLAEELGRAGVCVRSGLHCAPTAHKTAGTVEQGTLRFSFSPFNTMDEVCKASEVLKKIMIKA